MDAEMCKELGEFEVDLDGRFTSIRTSETNLGNFICDIMVAATNADLAVLNSGTFRSDAMQKGAIEVAPLAFMRGRTLNDSFII